MNKIILHNLVMDEHHAILIKNKEMEYIFRVHHLQDRQ